MITKLKYFLKDILSFLWFDYGVALLIILHLFVLKIIIQKIRCMGQSYNTKNEKIQHFLSGLSGNDYRVAMLSKLYQTVIGIIM